MKSSFVTLAVGCAGTLSMCVMLRVADAAQPPERLSNGHSFEGTWVRLDTAGSGSFDNLASKFEKPQFTAAGAAQRERMMARAQANRPPPTSTDGTPNKPGVPYVAVARPCSGAFFVDGSQGITPDSGPQHITVSKGQFLMAPERGGVRVIHIDGRGHPTTTHLSPRPQGHGIGHFENGVFLTDVVGLTAGNVMGGGLRSPVTRLNERFELSPDGQRLTITYTYTDAEIYTRPYTYSLEFERQPKPSFALDEWCDAGDPKEGYSITPPEQE